MPYVFTALGPLLFTVYIHDFFEAAFLPLFLFGIFLCSAGSAVTPEFLQGRTKRPVALRRAPFHVIFFGAGLCLGSCLYLGSLSGAFYTGIPADSAVWIEGTCGADSTRLRGGTLSVTLRLSRAADGRGTEASARGIVRLLAPGDRRLYWGEKIHAEGSFLLPPEGGGVPVFQGNIVKAGFADGRTPGGQRGKILPFRMRLCRALTEKGRRLGKDAGSLFNSLFLGVRDDLGVREQELFRRAGCMHILALSGMHLGIIGGILYFLFSPLLGKKRSFWLVGLGICIYLLLAGPKPSLLRAGIMFFLFGIGAAGGRKVRPLPVLFSSCILMIAVVPRTAHSLSFQLSFLALFGILYSGRKIAGLLGRFLPPAVSLPLSASLGAQTATAPLLLTVFGSLYPAGIVAGLFIAPLISVYILGGIVFLALPPGFFSGILSTFMQYLYRIIVAAAGFFGGIPALDRGNPYPTAIFTAAALLIPLSVLAGEIRVRWVWYRVYRKEDA